MVFYRPFKPGSLAQTHGFVKKTKKASEEAFLTFLRGADYSSANCW
jgi:hypothetical protein